MVVVFIHKKINFNNILSVSLVDKNDADYRSWVLSLINNQNKTDQSSSKRNNIIEKRPAIFELITELWNNGGYEEAESKKDLRLCMNCRHCAPDKYHIDLFVCWQGYLSGKPPHIHPTHSCNKIEMRLLPDKINFVWSIFKKRLDLKTSNFDKIGIFPGNFKFFLKDMGLIDDIKLGWATGKENEIRFFENIKQTDANIKFLPNIFKIKYKDNKIGFNILDGFILLPLGEQCIIEFKSASYYQDDVQNNDYIELFKISNIPLSTKSTGIYFLSIFKKHSDSYFSEYNDYNIKKIYPMPYINKIPDNTFFQIIKYQSDIIFSDKIELKNTRQLFEF